MDPEFEKFHKEIEFDEKVLESVLYFSRTEEKYVFPTIAEFILTELINATVEYLTGKESSIKYGGGYYKYFDFERTVEKLGIDAFNESRAIISEAIRDSILRLTELQIVYPTGPDRPYPDTRLYFIYKGHFNTGICDVAFTSKFSFSEELIRKIENETLPSLSKEDKSDCEAIGQLMRNYIERDLRYIEKHYHW